MIVWLVAGGVNGEKPGHNTSFVLVNVEQRETVLQN